MNDVFAWLKANDPKTDKITAIKWSVSPLLHRDRMIADECRNFTKFLVNKEGKVVGRFGSGTKPEDLKVEIEKYL